jgi:hypothetical protein
MGRFYTAHWAVADGSDLAKLAGCSMDGLCVLLCP